MSDRIDMSLDDIIKSNKKSKVKVAGGGTKAGGRMGGGLRSRSRSRGGGPPLKRSGITKAKVARSRSQNRARSQGGRGMRRVASAGSVRRSRSRSSFRREETFSSQGGARPGKLIITNLDMGVSEADIQELFAEFGALQSASLHYDKSGRSLGSADVVYLRKNDAVKAMKQYDGVPLDGKPMKIEMTSSQVQVNRVANVKQRSRSASARRRSQSGGPRGINKGQKMFKKGVVKGYKGLAVKKAKANLSLRGVKKDGKFKKRIVKGKKKTLPVSRETLDKEIDSFMKSR